MSKVVVVVVVVGAKPVREMSRSERATQTTIIGIVIGHHHTSI